MIVIYSILDIIAKMTSCSYYSLHAIVHPYITIHSVE